MFIAATAAEARAAGASSVLQAELLASGPSTQSGNVVVPRVLPASRAATRSPPEDGISMILQWKEYKNLFFEAEEATDLILLYFHIFLAA